MISRYVDFEIHLFTHDHKLMIDINGRPNAINLPEPIELSLDSSIETCAKIDKKTIITASFNFREVSVLSPQDVAHLGQKLYSSTFVSEVASRFQAYLRGREEQEGVRVCIGAQSGLLSDAAWEILCSDLKPIAHFLSLDPKTPVIRNVRSGNEVYYLRNLGKPLRLLVILSSPRFQAIDPRAEKLIWEQAVGHLCASGYIKVDFLGFKDREEASFDRLQELLSRSDSPYDIVHIIGHGLLETDDEGVIALVEPQDGRQHLVQASSLANLFRSRSVMLVVLQSCQSGAVKTPNSHFAGVAQHLVATGVPAVLAMQEFIDQDVARHFIEKLYTVWLDRECLFEDAITQARQSVYDKFADRLTSWAIPVLFISPSIQLIIRRSSFQEQAKVVSSVSRISFEVSERQIDAAIPQETRLNKQTELITLIRKPDDTGLRERISARAQNFEVKLEDVRTSPSFDVFFPIEEVSGKVLPKNVKLVIETSDFDVISAKEENIQIRPQGDSILFYFLVTPRKEGVARALIKVVDTSQGSVTLAQLLLKTYVRSGEAFETEYRVVDAVQVTGQETVRNVLSELRSLRQETYSFTSRGLNQTRLRETFSKLAAILASLPPLIRNPNVRNLKSIDYKIEDIAGDVEVIYNEINEMINTVGEIAERYEDAANRIAPLVDDIPLNNREDMSYIGYSIAKMQESLRACRRIIGRCEDLHLYIRKEDMRHYHQKYIEYEIYIINREIQDLERSFVSITMP